MAAARGYPPKTEPREPYTDFRCEAYTSFSNSAQTPTTGGGVLSGFGAGREIA
jgi:hypothetical protein